MKKILSIFLLLTVISSGVFARSVDSPSTTMGVVVVKEGAVFKLYYKGEEPMNVKVSIQNASGELIFKEMLKNSDGFVRPYNFSTLPEGDYTIKISNKNWERLESVTYQKDKIEELAHVVKISGSKKYILTVPNKVSGEIAVKIFDEADNILYSQKESIDSDFARVYNLEKYTGSFVFQITDVSGVTRSLHY